MPKPPGIRPVGTGQDKYMRIGVYANPGEGKTSLIGTSPRCLILDADRGTEVLQTRGLTKNVEKWEVSNWTDMMDAYEYLLNGGTNDYEWVWIDSLFGFQERGMDHIMSDLVVKSPHRKMYLPDKGEYGQNMNRLTLLMRDFRDLPINWGWTSHVMRTEDQDGEVLYMPMVQGRDMSAKVCSYMNLVGRVEKFMKEGTEQVRFTTTTKEKFYTKDRFKIGSILDPTIPKIMTKVNQARQTAPATANQSPGASKSSPAKTGAVKKAAAAVK